MKCVDGSDPDDRRQRGQSPFPHRQSEQQGFLFMHEYNEEEDIRGRLRLSFFLSYLMCVRYSELDPDTRLTGGGKGAVGLQKSSTFSK